MECTLKSTLIPNISKSLWDFLPDKNSFAFDLVGNVGDCEFIGERHSLHRDEMSLRRIANGCLAEEREVDDGGGVA